MKQLLLVLVVATAVMIGTRAAASSGGAMEVSVGAVRGSVVQIRFKTRARYVSACVLETQKISVVLQPRAVGGNRASRDGRIEIEAVRDPNSVCPRMPGVHTGSVSIPRGAGLPSLLDGDYGLVINGEEYGVLHLDEKVVDLMVEE